jgi:hypothetical protein
MDKPDGLDRKHLQTELEACKLIAEVNLELLDKNGLTQEQVANELGSAQGYLNESYQWDELGDQAKSHYALTEANIVIQGIRVVIKRILYQDSLLDDGNLQQGPILA